MKILDQLLEHVSGGLKLLVLIMSLAFSAYNFIVKTLRSEINEVEQKIMIIRNKDIELLDTKLDNLGIGLIDIKEQNKVIMNHLLRQKQGR